MKQKLRTISYEKRGSAMVWAVVSVLLLMIVVLGLLTLSRSFSRRAITSNAEKQAYLTALSAVDALCERVQQDNPLPETGESEFGYGSMNVAGTSIYGQSLTADEFDFPEAMGECTATLQCSEKSTVGATTTLTVTATATATVGRATETVTRTMELVTEKHEGHEGDEVKTDNDFWQEWLEDESHQTDEDYSADGEKCYAVSARISGFNGTFYVFEDCAHNHEIYPERHTEDCYKICTSTNHSNHYQTSTSGSGGWFETLARRRIKELESEGKYAEAFFLRLIFFIFDDNEEKTEHRTTSDYVETEELKIYEQGSVTTYTTTWEEDSYAKA